MSDLFATPTHRQPTAGEHPCRTCGAAACYFMGFTADAWAWCFNCAPADQFRPGRDKVTAVSEGGAWSRPGNTAKQASDDAGALTPTPPLRPHDLYPGETI